MGTPRVRTWVRAVVAVLLLAVTMTACTADGDERGADVPRADADGAGGRPSDPDAITVALDEGAVPLDPRLLGSNLPAWLGQERLTDPDLLALLDAIDVPIVRMPGGSWSNTYSWLGCELDDEQDCRWTWAAEPSDYLRFLEDTGIQGMWTVAFEGTAQEAAASVAFFNGQVGDATEIGPDRRGRDWADVDRWASLRASLGFPDPVGIELWEVGNEIYGARASTAPGCAAFGWEAVWTCDGGEYAVGSEEQDRDGFVDFHAAMTAVDPSISIGAVGVASDTFPDWDRGVLEGAGEVLDWYVIHAYGFGQRSVLDDALALPQARFPSVVARARDLLAEHVPGRDVPLGVTEYNLVAFQDGDEDALMDRAVNALFTADVLGLLAREGVSYGNHWNLVNGTGSTGTDYGLLDAETFERNPAYYAFALWSRFGDEVLPVAGGPSDEEVLSLHAGRDAGGALTLLAINKTAAVVDVPIVLGDGTGETSYGLVADVVAAADLRDIDVTFNGAADPSVDLSEPGEDHGTVGGQFTHSFAPTSITLLTLEPAG